MSLISVQQNTISCNRCSRLRSWCEKVAVEKRKSFFHETYWGKPVPGFGDTKAEVLIIGLAPAAHGANRTGRMFTGDNSGLWLYRSLYKHGFANQEKSTGTNDGLHLINTYITSVVHCAPPENKPTPEETRNCVIYLEQEIMALKRCRAIVVLGAFAWNGLFRILKQPGQKIPTFKHGRLVQMGNYTVIGSYHPSQQNTFTGKLTEKMFDSVFKKVNDVLRK